MEIIKKLFQLLDKKEKKLVYLIICMTFLMAIIEMLGILSIMPFLTFLMDSSSVLKNIYLKELYNFFSYEDSNEFLFLLGSITLCFFIISTVFKGFTAYFIYRFSYMREYSIGRRLVEGYLNESYNYFLEKNSSDLVKTVLSETSEVVGKGIMPMIELFAQIIICFILFSLIIFIDPFVAFCVSLSIGSSYLLMYFLIKNFIQKTSEDRFNANKKRYKILNEALIGIKEVKIFGFEKKISKEFGFYSKSMAQNLSFMMILKQVPRYTIEIIAFGGLLLIILFSMRDSYNMDTLIPKIAVYGFIGYRIMPSIQSIFNNIANLKYINKSLDSLLLDYKSKNKISMIDDHSKNIFTLTKSIELKNAFFKYKNDSKYILNNLNIKIKAKSIVGIVGKTGSGKTTLVDIILGLLRLQSGQLLFDKKRLTKNNLRNFQKNCAYVPQNIFLIDDTIKANIAFGIKNDDIDMNKLQQAAKMADIYDYIINLTPKGFDTKVGDRGIKISGGQRQRIGLARALYKQPTLLILDEGTSALDIHTETKIMKSIFKLQEKITIILVAHRFSTIKKCNTIFIMENGEVASYGDYEYLSKSNKFLSDLDH